MSTSFNIVHPRALDNFLVSSYDSRSEIRKEMAMIKKPKDLVVNDVFEEPESEEEFHRGRADAQPREKYRVVEIGMVTEDGFVRLLAKRLSDGYVQDVILVPWVPLEVLDSGGALV